MKKYEVYAIVLVIFSLLMWLGYYVCLEHTTTEYKNGTFVKAPVEQTGEEMERSA